MEHTLPELQRSDLKDADMCVFGAKGFLKGFLKGLLKGLLKGVYKGSIGL